MITADHGCDPAKTDTTDHTREYIPLLVYGKGIKTPKSSRQKRLFRHRSHRLRISRRRFAQKRNELFEGDNEMKEQELINAAERAMKKIRTPPDSHFNVGAALLCKDGKLYLGANVENSSFSLCCCAERNAFFRAVNDGRAGV